MKRMALVLLLAGCPKPGPAPVTPVGLDGPASCASACANGRRLGCAFAQPTPAGAPCEEVCANAVESPAPPDLDCWTAAASCAAVDSCQVRTR